MHVHNQMQDEIEASSSGLLDNPIYAALTTDHAHLALGNDLARRYPEDIGPLSGMPEQSADAYDALRSITSPGDVVALFLLESPRPSPGWTFLRGGLLHQMIASQPSTQAAVLDADAHLRPLTAADVPSMVELAELTEPGPFRRRTIELGGFFGIEQSGRLLAMAGKRLHLPGFIEVSAVCTHPDARGRGYARMLMSRVIDEIVYAGKTPILHTFAHNHSAIRVYHDLGFIVRQSFQLAVLRRDG
jgi:GNAT superfamily N-acetyltransferase